MDEKITETAPRKTNTAAKILGMTPVQRAELMACAADHIDTPAFRIEPNSYVRFRGRGGKGIGYANEVVAFCAKLGVEPLLAQIEEATTPAVTSAENTVPEVHLSPPAQRPVVAIDQNTPETPSSRSRSWIVATMATVFLGLAMLASWTTRQRIGGTSVAPETQAAGMERREHAEQQMPLNPPNHLEPSVTGAGFRQVTNGQAERRERERQALGDDLRPKDEQGERRAIELRGGSQRVTAILNHLVAGDRLPDRFLSQEVVENADLAGLSGPPRQIIENLILRLHLSREFTGRDLSERLGALTFSRAVLRVQGGRVRVEIFTSSPATLLDLGAYLARNTPAVESDGVRVRTSASGNGQRIIEGPELEFYTSQLVGSAWATTAVLIIELRAR